MTLQFFPLRTDIVIKFIQIDLLDKNCDYKIFQAYNASHLLHLAWYAEHGKFWNSLINFEWSFATLRLVTAFIEAGGEHIVISGSCAEYDWSFGYLDEEVTPCNPKSNYGISKNVTRQIIQSICDYNQVSLAWARIFFSFGEGENDNKLIPSIIQVLLGKKDPFPINLHHWRDFISVHKIADALIFLLNKKFSGVVNICSKEPVQIEHLVDYIGSICEKDTDIILNLKLQDNSNDFLIGNNYLIKSTGFLTETNFWTDLQDYTNNFMSRNIK